METWVVWARSIAYVGIRDIHIVTMYIMRRDGERREGSGRAFVGSPARDKSPVASEMKPITPIAVEDDRSAIPGSSRFGLFLLFWLGRHVPGVLPILKPLAVRLAVRCSASVREGVFANARRLLGTGASAKERAVFADKVVGNFYDFVADVAVSGTMTAAQLRGRVEVIEGREAYLARRKAGGGAIIVTAHMGSFEVGLAALADVEPYVHVVFKRDRMDGFETIRRTLRANLGILEAPIDDGWDTWLRLRDALARNHVVVMQGDRAMPGQKAQAVPMLGGHVMLPLGPLKLAQISGSPIIPVFSMRSPGGRYRLIAEPAILVDAEADLIDGVHPALLELGNNIQKHVSAHPDQWLMLTPAFVEDLANPSNHFVS
jgi:phosphatidylinositol dimannoside acyltransferase